MTQTPTPTAGPAGTHDVVYISGSKRMGFRLQRTGGVVEQRVNTFAPAVRTGNDPAFSESVFSKWGIQGLHHGVDQYRFETSALKAFKTDAGVTLFREGVVTLASQWAVEDAGVSATAPQIVEYDVVAGEKYIVYAAGTKLRKRTQSTGLWSDEAPAGGFTTNAVWVHPHGYLEDNYLFVACGVGLASMLAQCWDGAAWISAGLRALAFFTFLGSLYAVTADKDKVAAQLKKSTNAGSTWSDPIEIGDQSVPISGIWVSNNLLIIGKPDGLFAYNGSAVSQLLDLTHIRYADNFKLGVEFEGFGYSFLLDTIRRVSFASNVDANFADMTPRRKGTRTAEVYGHGLPKVLFLGPQHLYAAFDDGSAGALGTNTYPELLRSNSVGWEPVYIGADGDTMLAAGFSRNQNWALINDGSTRRKRVVDRGGAEYPDHCASGYFVLPKYDAGFPQMVKVVRDITITARDCDDDNTIAVYYRTDDVEDVGAWTLVGAATGEGTTTLTFGGIDAQVPFRTLDLKFVLTRDPSDVTKTPVLELPIVVSVLTVPEAQHVFRDRLLLGAVEMRRRLGPETATVDEQLAFLMALEDTQNSVIRVDQWGRRRRVRNTDLTREDVENDPVEQEAPVVQMTFIETFTGLRSQVITIVKAAVEASATLHDPAAFMMDGTCLMGFTEMSNV